MADVYILATFFNAKKIAYYTDKIRYKHLLMFTHFVDSGVVSK